MMECILCAKDMGEGCSSWLVGVESSGGDIRFVGIGETASSTSSAEEGDLDKVGDGLACSVVTLSSGANHLEGGNSSGPVVLVLACLQNRCKGVGDATLSAPSPSLACVCSLSTGESDRGGWDSVSGSGGIVEGFVSGVLKDLKRCRSPTKRGVGVGVGWESDGLSSSVGDIAGESPVQRKSGEIESRVYEVHSHYSSYFDLQRGFPHSVIVTWRWEIHAWVTEYTESYRTETTGQ